MANTIFQSPERANQKTRKCNAALIRPFRASGFLSHLTQGGAALCPGLHYRAPLGLTETDTEHHYCINR
jgi:hypothetical protein